MSLPAADLFESGHQRVEGRIGNLIGEFDVAEPPFIIYDQPIRPHVRGAGRSRQRTRPLS